MRLVTVKDKFQVTIPASLRKTTGIRVGDLLSVEVKRGAIVFTIKSVVDRAKP